MNTFWVLLAGLVLVGVIAAIGRGMAAQQRDSNSAAYCPPTTPKILPLTGMEASDWREMYSIDDDPNDREADNGLFEAFVLGSQPRAVERYFYLTIAGTAHKNDDNSSRIRAIRKCGPGDSLDLVHEADNPYDPNAVAVWFEDGQLGYLDARLAGETVRDARRNGMRRRLYFRHANHHPTNGRTVGATAFMVLLETAPTPE